MLRKYHVFSECYEATSQSEVVLDETIKGTLPDLAGMPKHFWMMNDQKRRALLETLFGVLEEVVGTVSSSSSSSSSSTLIPVPVIGYSKPTITINLGTKVDFVGKPFCLAASWKAYPILALELLLSMPIRSIQAICPAFGCDIDSLWCLNAANLGLYAWALVPMYSPSFKNASDVSVANKPPHAWTDRQILLLLLTYWEFLFRDFLPHAFAHSVSAGMFHWFCRYVLYQAPVAFPGSLEKHGTVSERSLFRDWLHSLQTSGTMDILIHKAHIVGSWLRHELHAPDHGPRTKRSRNQVHKCNEHKQGDKTDLDPILKPRLDDVDLPILQDIGLYAKDAEKMIAATSMDTRVTRLVKIGLEDDSSARMLLIDYLKWDEYQTALTANEGEGDSRQWVLFWDTALPDLHEQALLLDAEHRDAVIPIASPLEITDRNEVHQCVLAHVGRSARQALALVGWIRLLGDHRHKNAPPGTSILLLAPHVGQFIQSRSPWMTSLYYLWLNQGVRQVSVAPLQDYMAIGLKICRAFPSMTEFLAKCHGLLPWILGTWRSTTVPTKSAANLFKALPPDEHLLKYPGLIRIRQTVLATDASATRVGPLVTLSGDVMLELMHQLASETPERMPRLVSFLANTITSANAPMTSSQDVGELSTRFDELVGPMEKDLHMPWISDFSYHAAQASDAVAAANTSTLLVASSYFGDLLTPSKDTTWSRNSADWIFLMCVYELYSRMKVLCRPNVPPVDSRYYARWTSASVLTPVAVVHEQRMGLLSTHCFPACRVRTAKGTLSPEIYSFLTHPPYNVSHMLRAMVYSHAPSAFSGVDDLLDTTSSKTPPSSPQQPANASNTTADVDEYEL